MNSGNSIKLLFWNCWCDDDTLNHDVLVNSEIHNNHIFGLYEDTPLILNLAKAADFDPSWRSTGGYTGWLGPTARIV